MTLAHHFNITLEMLLSIWVFLFLVQLLSFVTIQTLFRLLTTQSSMNVLSTLRLIVISPIIIISMAQIDCSQSPLSSMFSYGYRTLDVSCWHIVIFFFFCHRDTLWVWGDVKSIKMFYVFFLCLQGFLVLLLFFF